MTPDQEELLRDVRAELAKAAAGPHPDTVRLDWWFDCNERERGHVMALVHMQGMSKRDAIDRAMSAKKGAK